MDIYIFYEHAQRELNNAYLLKYELEKRGYDVLIVKTRDVRMPFFEKPKLVITPWLYNDHESLEPIKLSFIRGFDKILNLQYEQVISKMWIERGFHCPSGLAQNATHVCWGDKIKRRLMHVGVPENNLLVVGDLKTDFSKNPFKKLYKSKEELGKEFNIPADHKWNLFISSFSLTNLDEKHKQDVLKIMKDSDFFNEFQSIQIKTQEIIVNWIEKFIQNHSDIEFIYRPHPSELSDEKLLQLDKNYDNFHYISTYSIQEWIVNSDVINSWISTSLIEVYVLGKNCNILRPLKVPEKFDIPYFINANHISDYNTFEKFNLFNPTTFPISKNILTDYYNLDEEFVYKKIADYAELMINSDSPKKFYKHPPFLEISFLMLRRVFSKNFFKLLYNFFSTDVAVVEDEEYFNKCRRKKLKKWVWDN